LLDPPDLNSFNEDTDRAEAGARRTGDAWRLGLKGMGVTGYGKRPDFISAPRKRPSGAKAHFILLVIGTTEVVP
jgi:hypothetical protein